MMFDSVNTIRTFEYPTEMGLKTGAWYDADYYSGLKSNWKGGYNWDSHGFVFEAWAKFIVWGFPRARKFLDVGCAKGMLERAMVELKERNGALDFSIEGFDVSDYALTHAEEIAMPMIRKASTDDFKFEHPYDVMIQLDVFEHLTEEQSRTWLTRSRNFIDDSLLAVIALDEPHQRDEPSHINLRDRSYWHDLIRSCGWNQPLEAEFQERLAMRADINKSGLQFFVYRSRG